MCGFNSDIEFRALPKPDARTLKPLLELESDEYICASVSSPEGNE